MEQGSVKYVIRNREEFYRLYLAIEKRLSNMEIQIVLNFRFLEPMDILILTKFIIRQKGRGCTIKIFSNSEVLQYLKMIGLVSFINRNADSSSMIEGIPSLTAMPLRRVERTNMNEYINATQMFMRTLCPTKELSMLDLCLAELINNVYDHAHSPIDAYVFCQYYPKNKIIKVAVSDLGIGIPKSVNSFLHGLGKDVLSGAECVKWAIKENQTTMSIPQNMGKGLDVVNSFVKANNSSWKVYSDDVLMMGYPSGNKYHVNPIYNFIGTIIGLNIKVDNLAEREFVGDDWDW